jgi:hypothetical protein
MEKAAEMELMQQGVDKLEKIKHRILIFSAANFISAIAETQYDLFGGLSDEQPLTICQEIDTPKSLFDIFLNILQDFIRLMLPLWAVYYVYYYKNRIEFEGLNDI